jgi:chromosome partitioning protein
MKATLIGGEKGGTGKSTLSTNLAIMASLMGKDVLLLDADKQETATKFISKRNDKGIKPTPLCLQRRGKHLSAEIEDLVKRYEVVIIESGGQDSVELRAAMACSAVESFYTPLQPSEFDMDTVEKMEELVGLAQSYNPNLRAFVLFNQAPTHSKISTLEDAMEICTKLENLSACQASMSHRIPFQYAATDSLSVVEFELERIKALPSYQAKKYQPKASMEICAIYKEIFHEDFTGEIINYFPQLHLVQTIKEG